MSRIDSATIVAPINNSTLYTEKPRILFKTNYSDNELIIPYITIKNKNGIFVYTSTRNPDMFSCIVKKADSNFVFIPNNIAEGENQINIRLYDGEYFSNETSIVFNYIPCLISAVNSETKITANLYKNLVTMTNHTLIAYNKDSLSITIPLPNENKIYRRYFSEINNKLYDMNNWINENYPGLNRYREYKIINIDIIRSDMFNSLLQYILEP